MTLIDTDILIDAGRNIRTALDHLDRIRAGSVAAMSVVTQLELMVGCRDKAEMRKLARFLTKFQVVPLNAPISERAVDLLRLYRLSHGLLIADGLIAATALVLGHRSFPRTSAISGSLPA